MLPCLLWLVTACGGPSTDGPQPSEDTTPSDTLASDTGSSDTGSPDTTLPDDDSGLYGTFPDADVALPEFAATNSDGSARSREDILGSPTVMWFFPAAGTYG